MAEIGASTEVQWNGKAEDYHTTSRFRVGPAVDDKTKVFKQNEAVRGWEFTSSMSTYTLIFIGALVVATKLILK